MALQPPTQLFNTRPLSTTAIPPQQYSRPSGAFGAPSGPLDSRGHLQPPTMSMGGPRAFSPGNTVAMPSMLAAQMPPAPAYATYSSGPPTVPRAQVPPGAQTFGQPVTTSRAGLVPPPTQPPAQDYAPQYDGPHFTGRSWSKLVPPMPDRVYTVGPEPLWNDYGPDLPGDEDARNPYGETEDDFGDAYDEEDEPEPLTIHRAPLVSNTAHDFVGEIPDTAYMPHEHAQHHETVHRSYATAQKDFDRARHELQRAEAEMHHMQEHAHHHMMATMPLSAIREVDTERDRVYRHPGAGNHVGAPVLKHGGGIQEVEPYPFWIGAGTPAARLEPTWIGGEWYLVAPVDFKGLDNSMKTHGYDKQRQYEELRIVDDALKHLESEGHLPSFPPPRHWKEHKHCPIA